MKRLVGFLTLVMFVLFGASCAVSDEQVSADSRSNAPGTSGTTLASYPEVPEVSFDHNPSVFGGFEREVVAEYRLQEPDHKPDGVAPRHVKIETASGRDGRNTVVEVYPLEGFLPMYAANGELAEWVNEKIESLKVVMENKDHRLRGEIPHLPYADVSQDTIAQVRHVPFKNGKGVLFVMSWSHGIEFVNNDRLFYRYEGLTDDGKFYVTAEMPIRVAFLPEDEGANKVDGYTWEELVTDTGTNSERPVKYLADVTERLERLRDKDFTPALHQFEALVRSIKVGEN